MRKYHVIVYNFALGRSVDIVEGYCGILAISKVASWPTEAVLVRTLRGIYLLNGATSLIFCCVAPRLGTTHRET